MLRLRQFLMLRGPEVVHWGYVRLLVLLQFRDVRSVPKTRRVARHCDGSSRGFRGVMAEESLVQPRLTGRTEPTVIT